MVYQRDTFGRSGQPLNLERWVVHECHVRICKNLLKDQHIHNLGEELGQQIERGSPIKKRVGRIC